MKRRKPYFLIITTLIVFSLFSCASTTAENRIDSVYVMAYGYDNCGIMNVSVFLDGEETGQTDIYGRLLFAFDREKEVLVRAEKKGYETIETKTKIKPGTVLYFKMGSAAHYAKKAEKLFDEHEAKSALKAIEKALEIETRKDFLYLQDIILSSQEKEDEYNEE